MDNPTFEIAFEQFVKNLNKVYDMREASNIAKIVFEDVFQMTAGNKHRVMTRPQLAEYQNITDRLLNNEPLQYVIGHADFYGLQLDVDNRVLIPRPETEELVHWIIQDHKFDHPNGKDLRLLDIGTGSGCIPLAIKKNLGETDVEALDISRDALKVARINAQKLDLDVKFRNLDITAQETWSDLEPYDVIVSNPPYVLEKERNMLPDNVIRYEPSVALFVNTNTPLKFYRIIADFALARLNSGGHLYFEVHESHGQQVIDMLVEKGFKRPTLEKDLSGKDRMVRVGV
ncbi:MAG: peptide chain release factor N(5)-glutamine methyltransferase [Bacteroidota bacterium]